MLYAAKYGRLTRLVPSEILFFPQNLEPSEVREQLREQRFVALGGGAQLLANAHLDDAVPETPTRGGMAE